MQWERRQGKQKPSEARTGDCGESIFSSCELKEKHQDINFPNTTGYISSNTASRDEEVTVPLLAQLHQEGYDSLETLLKGRKES